MALFDFFASGPSDKDVGHEVLRAYFEEASKFPEFGYTDFDSWLVFLQSRVPDILELVGGLVNANAASTTVSGSAERMAQLGNESGGQATIPQLVAVAGGKGDSINWAQAVPEIAVETLSDVGSEAYTLSKNIKSGVLDTANMVKYLPWILGGAGILFIMGWSRSSGAEIGKGVRSLAEAGARKLGKR